MQTPSPAPSQTLSFERAAHTAKALASPRRLHLLDLLVRGERSVEALARLAGMSVANASRHLQILRAAGVVEVRRAGLFAHYRLVAGGGARVWAALRDLGEERPEPTERPTPSAPQKGVPQPDLTPPRVESSSAPAIGVRQLRARLADPHLLVLDVRPREEYRAGHIPRALSVPLAELEALLPQLPGGREWIACARGPGCEVADEAVALMRRRGFNAHCLSGGVAAWRAARLPVQQIAQR